jgi:nitroreductase
VELYDVMRTTFSAREFTDAPVPDATLQRIFENARFASSGGNRQGWHAIVIREKATKVRLAELAIPAARRYTAQRAAGEGPWNPVAPTSVSAETIANTRVPNALTEPVVKAPVVIVVCVDLRVVAAVDQNLERIAVVPGGSIYPFTWNILLSARNEGLGGTLTTMPIHEEPLIKELLGIPAYVAVAAVIPMGVPVKQLRKLTRKPVREIVTRERWDGPAFEG